jgi:hypothetical protein
LDATNVEKAFRDLIVDIYRNWAARMDSMKEDASAISNTVSQTIKPSYPGPANPGNGGLTKSCCG